MDSILVMGLGSTNLNFELTPGKSYELSDMIGGLGIHTPVYYRYYIEYNNKTYTVEAVYE